MKTTYLVADSIMPVKIKNTLLEELEKKGICFEERIHNMLSVTLVDTIVEYVAKNSFTLVIRCEAVSCEFKTTKPERCLGCKHNLDTSKEIDCEVSDCKKHLTDPAYCIATCHHNKARKQNIRSGGVMEEIFKTQDTLMAAAINRDFSDEAKKRLANTD